MYEFASGPLVWIALIVFVGGTAYKLITMGKLAKKDKIVYPYMNFKFGVRSILHWLMPFGTTNMRLRPFFTIISFLFHFCLLIAPLFVLGHVVLFEQSWGFNWGALPEGLTNTMAIVIVAIGVIFALRRIADPTVRMISNYKDWLVLLLVLSPFVTGIMAYYQVFNYEAIVILHMFAGAAWLMLIPFTRLSHMFFFFVTRAYMGSEFGYVRNSKDW